jgi:hypothetical protein
MASISCLCGLFPGNRTLRAISLNLRCRRKTSAERLPPHRPPNGRDVRRRLLLGATAALQHRVNLVRKAL